jgi:HEAT repeat protein
MDTATLIEHLGSEDATCRQEAAKWLAQQGPVAEPAVAALTAALADEEALVRAHAARALGKIGEAAKPSVGDLIKLVTDEDAYVQRAAVRAMRQLDPDPAVVVPKFIELLEASDHGVAVAALHAIADVGEPNMELLNAALKSENANYWALLLIAEMGAKAKDAVPAVLPLLDHARPEVRMHALMALGEIGPDAADAAEAVAKALDDQQLDCQSAAVFALARIGAADDATKQKLTGMLEHEDTFLPLVAAWALAHLQPDNQEALKTAVEKLVPALASEDPGVRAGAARGLVDLKPPTEMMRPLMQQTVPKMSREALAGFANVVVEMGSEDIVPRCREALADEKLRDAALAVVVRLGDKAGELVPELVDALGTVEDEAVRSEIQFALASIGPDAAPAVDELIKSLDSEHEECKEGAIYALGKIGPAAAAAVDKLKTYLTSDDSELRTIAVWALRRIEPENEETAALALPVLIELLQDDVALVRMEAARSLGEMGAQAQSAAESLEELLKDPNPDVRRIAKAAIEAIGKEP